MKDYCTFAFAMKILKYLFWTLWHVWFYVLTTLLIVLLLPVLLVFTARREWYPQLYWVARNLWARPILYGMGWRPMDRSQRAESREQRKWRELAQRQYVKSNEQRVDSKSSKLKAQSSHSQMLIANHTSMSDIMLMLVCSRAPFVFVGKKELAKLPLFGFFYHRAVIMVDRSSAQSRREVYTQAMERIAQGLSICIFPEGGVPDDESIVLDKFKDGAFRIAIECQIPIVPIVFYDNKHRFPYRFFAGSPGRMRVEVLPTISTEGLILEDKESLKAQCHKAIYDKLLGDSFELLGLTR